MNRSKLFILPFILVFTSCLKVPKDCTILKEPEAPDGFEINKISTIEFDGKLINFQFVSNETGFALGEKEESDDLEIFKTEDGGFTWEALNVMVELRPINMMFLDENIGLVSHYGPDPSVLRTSDGGLTWEQLTFPDLKGRIDDIQKDANGNLYAMTSEIGILPCVIKSSDQGLTWEVIYEIPNLYIDLLLLHQEQLFIVTTDKTILVIDSTGDYQKTIEFYGTSNNTVELQIIDENHLVLTSFYKVIRTMDGGMSWTRIYDNSSRILHFKNPSDGLMILNKGYCGDNPIEASAIASTENGGTHWKESERIEYLVDRFTGIHQRSEDNYLILVDNSLYELKQF